ncbi:MAG: pyrroline-5-carboxylate reductase [Sphingobium sp.]
MVGCGNMAGAMLSRWLECGLDPADVTVLRPSGRAVAPGVRVMAEWPGTMPHGAVVVLGMKPQQLGQVAPKLAPLLADNSTVVSLLAGVTMQVLRDALGGDVAMIRAMPNTPVALGQGVCALYADSGAGETARNIVVELMAPLGLVEWISDEGQFNLITALSGCGPAFVFRFIDAMASAASDLGMTPDQAQRLAMATVQGAASLAAASSVDPAQLADNVASPGGMTREGLNVMDNEGRMKALLLDTLRAARDRGEALARQASTS